MCPAPIKLVTDPVLDDALRVSPEFRLEADVRGAEIDDNGLDWSESTTEL